MKPFFIQMTRLTSLIFVVIPATTLPWLFSLGVEPILIAMCFGIWSFGIGYIDRGWKEYLRSIGEI